MGNHPWVQNTKEVGSIIWNGIKNIGTSLRAGSNIWIKWWLVLQAWILDQYTWVLPDIVWETASNIADKIPQILNIETEIPGVSDFILSFPQIQEFAQDVNNVWNIWAYMSAFALVHLFSKYVLRWEKGSFEATTSAIVWTALSVGIFKEMVDVMNGYGHDIMSWLPHRFFEALPELVREDMMDADKRQNIYAGTLWTIGIGTSVLAGKNMIRAVVWRRKSIKK